MKRKPNLFRQSPVGRSRQGRLLRAFLAAGMLAMFTTSFLAQAVPASSDVIHVEISGLRNDKGQVLCALFTSAKDFPKNGDKAVAQTATSIVFHSHTG